jgi:NADP-dependent aldehyde dehydrogenase
MTDVVETVADTTIQELDRLLEKAVAAAPLLAAERPADRAVRLRAVADALDAAGEQLIPLAAEESHLGVPRLTGELKRTTFQLRLFAGVLDEGAYL